MRILTKVSFQVSICGQERKVNFYVVPSFLNSERLARAIFVIIRFLNCEFVFGCPLVVNPFSTRNSYCLLVCVLRSWLDKWQVGDAQNLVREKCGLHSICS